MEHRVKLYVPTEESFPIPLKYIDVSRTTDKTLDVMLEKQIDDYWNVDEGHKCTLGCNAGENIDDDWNVDGDRELSDTWTTFTRFTTPSEQPPDG